MKHHQKLLATPKTWALPRKSKIYVTRGIGSNKTKYAYPLTVAVRDILKIALSTKEIKHVLNEKAVLLNGKVPHIKSQIGLFDVIEFPKRNQSFRLTLTKKGKLSLISVPNEKTKVARITNIISITGNKLQACLSDGRSIIIKKDFAKVGDSFLLSMPKGEVSQVLQLKKKSSIFLISGSHIGHIAHVENIDKQRLFFSLDGKTYETTKSAAIVVGVDKPLVTIQ